MEYSIQELSRLSGVTTRTLRWYDQIGLLKPSRIAANGYRCYGPAQVDRLQDILYYRALGVELARIKAYLDDPSFDRRAALKSHLAALETRRRQLDRLIDSVQRTIDAQERNEIMNDHEKFEAFKEETIRRNEADYGPEARRRYGSGPVDAAHKAIRGMTPAAYQEWTSLDQEILARLEDAVRSGASPDGPEGQALTRLHRRWLTFTIPTCDAAQHRGIAALYVADPRFTAYYDRNLPGCARFLSEAVARWAE